MFGHLASGPPSLDFTSRAGPLVRHDRDRRGPDRVAWRIMPSFAAPPPGRSCFRHLHVYDWREQILPSGDGGTLSNGVRNDIIYDGGTLGIEVRNDITYEGGTLSIGVRNDIIYLSDQTSLLWTWA